MTRKIIQIATAASEGVLEVLALCDDGSVWRHRAPEGWYPFVSIPQDVLTEGPPDAHDP